ncbi:trypsin-like serine protease, partial [Vibrio sp.]|uniref:trypsin-like serine protease n=1 Tax=Vibrio sp. TaxID=678 RepID=UPI00311EF020
MNKKLASIALTIASYSAVAVENGTPHSWTENADLATFNCTGTLLGGKYLITAGHCELQKGNIAFSDGSWSNAVVNNHPGGIGDPNGPDVAVWNLEQIHFTEDIHFIANLGSEPVSNGDYIDIYGFAGSQILNVAKTQIDILGTSNTNWYSTKDIGAGITEAGDSGGPWLNQDGDIVAIHNSGADGTMLATSLYVVKDWLLEQINGWHYPTLKTGNGNISIKVQSLHQGGVADSAYTTGDITLTGGSCVGHTLSAFETCTYDVSAPNSASG